MNMYNQHSAEVLSLPMNQYDLTTSEPQLCWRGGGRRRHTTHSEVASLFTHFIHAV